MEMRRGGNLEKGHKMKGAKQVTWTGLPSKRLGDSEATESNGLGL